MKTNQCGPFSSIGLGIITCFSGCGDDPAVAPQEESRIVSFGQGSYAPVMPKANIEKPGAKWIGTKTEFTAVFEERNATNPDQPLDYAQLFVRSGDVAYSGSINRFHQNETLEFMGNYIDGYLDGLALWWDGSGSLLHSFRVQRGLKVKAEVPPDAEELAATSLIPKKIGLEETLNPSEPIFVGDNNTLAQWTTVASEGGDEYLLDKRTGKKVTGGLKVHDAVGRISYYSEYKAGKLHGRNDNWHATGMKMIESNYANGQKHGMETWRNEEGVPEYQAYYENGKLHGVMTTWNGDGEVASQLRYENGEVVEEIFVQPPPPE